MEMHNQDHLAAEAERVKRQRRQSAVKTDGNGGNVVPIPVSSRAFILQGANTVVEVIPVLEWEPEATDVFTGRPSDYSVAVLVPLSCPGAAGLGWEVPSHQFPGGADDTPFCYFMRMKPSVKKLPQTSAAVQGNTAGFAVHALPEGSLQIISNKP